VRMGGARLEETLKNAITWEPSSEKRNHYNQKMGAVKLTDFLLNGDNGKIKALGKTGKDTRAQRHGSATCSIHGGRGWVVKEVSPKGVEGHIDNQKGVRACGKKTERFWTLRGLEDKEEIKKKE